MKKKYQKGFVLAEAFIVSTFVLGVLVFMFLQIKTIINGYDKSFSYNTISGIYHAMEVKKYLQNSDYENLVDQVEESDFVVLNKSDILYSEIFKAANINVLIISNGDLKMLKENNVLSFKLKDYIKTLTNSTDYKLIFEFNDNTFATIKG